MEAPLPSHFQHQPLHDPNLFQPPPHHHSIVSQLDLDPTDPFQFNAQFDAPNSLSHLQPRNVLDPQLQQESRFPDIQPPGSQHARHLPSRPGAKTPTPAQGGQFGVLTPHLQVPNRPQTHHESLDRLQNDFDIRPVAEAVGDSAGGHFSNLKMIPDPPNLDAWRSRLFNVDDVIELTEEE